MGIKETVAKAIYTERVDELDLDPWDESTHRIIKEECMNMAGAAIEAVLKDLREPSAQALGAGSDTICSIVGSKRADRRRDARHVLLAVLSQWEREVKSE